MGGDRTDLITEGLYTRRIKHKPEHGSDLLAWVWSGISAWGLLGVFIAGPLIQHVGPFRAAWLGVPFSAAVVLPTVLGWHGERPVCGVDAKPAPGATELPHTRASPSERARARAVLSLRAS